MSDQRSAETSDSCFNGTVEEYAAKATGRQKVGSGPKCAQFRNTSWAAKARRSMGRWASVQSSCIGECKERLLDMTAFREGLVKAAGSVRQEVVATEPAAEEQLTMHGQW